MTRRRVAAVLVAGLPLACGDVAAPERPMPYDFAVPVSANPPLVFRWPAASLPVRVWAEEGLDLPRAVSAGLDAWRAAGLYGEFRGAVVSDSTLADVIVRIGGQGQPPLLPTELACRGSTAMIVARDTTIVLPFRITIEPRPGFSSEEIQFCIPRVAMHELGHALGLFQHSSDSADMMFGSPRVAALSPRDRSTFGTLYHTTPTIGMPKVVLSTPDTTGPAPLMATFTADVSDSAMVVLSYAFWWDCSHDGADMRVVKAACGDPADPAIGATFNSVTDDPKRVTHQYVAAGSYRAKVIVERRVPRPLEHRVAVTVTAPGR